MKTITAIVILLLSIVSTLADTTNILTVTAYCNCVKCCGKWAKYQKTASGVKPQQGVTCAASRKIPFGTVLEIEGVGKRIVQDRLAAKYDARVDIFFTNHLDAVKFGKKTLRVISQSAEPAK